MSRVSVLALGATLYMPCTREDLADALLGAKNGPQRSRTKEWTYSDLRGRRLGHEEIACPSHPSSASDPNVRRGIRRTQALRRDLSSGTWPPCRTSLRISRQRRRSPLRPKLVVALPLRRQSGNHRRRKIRRILAQERRQRLLEVARRGLAGTAPAKVHPSSSCAVPTMEGRAQAVPMTQRVT